MFLYLWHLHFVFVYTPESMNNIVQLLHGESTKESTLIAFTMVTKATNVQQEMVIITMYVDKVIAFI